MEYVHFDSEDLKKNNVASALGCVLFPIPLIACPDSKLGRFCANQGLVFCLAMIALKLVFGIAGAAAGLDSAARAAGEARRRAGAGRRGVLCVLSGLEGL